jgi:hypothetical protein
VRGAAEQAEHLAGVACVGGFAEGAVAERDHRVSREHHAVGQPFGDGSRLLERQVLGDLAGQQIGRVVAFVDVGGHDLERVPRLAQKLLAPRGRAGEHEARGCERRGQFVRHETRVRGMGRRTRRRQRPV